MLFNKTPYCWTNNLKEYSQIFKRKKYRNYFKHDYASQMKMFKLENARFLLLTYNIFIDKCHFAHLTHIYWYVVYEFWKMAHFQNEKCVPKKWLILNASLKAPFSTVLSIKSNPHHYLLQHWKKGTFHLKGSTLCLIKRGINSICIGIQNKINLNIIWIRDLFKVMNPTKNVRKVPWVKAKFFRLEVRLF